MTTAPEAPDRAALIDRERSRVDALIAADKSATSRLLADDFTYTHSTGKVDTRESYLAAFGTRYDFVSAEHADLSVRQYGETAIVAGDLDIVLAPKGGTRRISRLRFISVWTRTGGEWKLAAFQNTSRADG